MLVFDLIIVMVVDYNGVVVFSIGGEIDLIIVVVFEEVIGEVVVDNLMVLVIDFFVVEFLGLVGLKILVVIFEKIG